MSFATCKERATPPDGPKRSRPSGCAAFARGLRCSLGQYRKIQPLRSRLGQCQNRQQRGSHEYFNRLPEPVELNRLAGSLLLARLRWPVSLASVSKFPDDDGSPEDEFSDFLKKRDLS